MWTAPATFGWGAGRTGLLGEPNSERPGYRSGRLDDLHLEDGWSGWSNKRLERSGTLAEWEKRFEAFLQHATRSNTDVAHDLEHTRRVVANAKVLAGAENADLHIVIPAAWLHDCVIVSKHSEQRSGASRRAAEAAGRFLRQEGYTLSFIDQIEHAIVAHSYSANVEPRTIEAKIVQDADRLDALGAVGIARALMLGGVLGLELYDPNDPFANSREPDSRAFVIDHFFEKLLKLPSTMQTQSGRQEAEARVVLMKDYLRRLRKELEFGERK